MAPADRAEVTAAVVHWKERMWEGQTSSGANDELANRYYGAYRNPEKMRKLVDEGRRGWHEQHHNKHHSNHRKSM